MPEFKEDDGKLEILSPPDHNDAPPRRRGLVIALIVGGLAAGVLIFGIRSRVKAEASLRSVTQQMAVPSVSVVLPKPTASAEEVILPGNIQPFISSPIYARTDGYLKAWYFDIGAHVKQGQLLATIQTPEVDEQLQQSLSNLNTAKANLALAETTKNRYEGMIRSNAVSQQDVDNQEAAVGQFEGAVRIDQAQIDNARLNLDYARIASPIDGVTGVRLVDPGNLVRTSDANGIVVITQLDPVAVLFTLPQDYLPQVAQQMELGTLAVEAYSRDGNVKLGSGELLVIDNQINQNTATMRLKATFANPQRVLWPNQFVKARLLLTVRKGAIVVPSTAVQRGPEGTFAYVVGPDQTVQPRPVEVELTQGDVTAIARGLTPGEVVVADGAAALRSGAKVAPRPPAARPAQPSGRAIGAER